MSVPATKDHRPSRSRLDEVLADYKAALERADLSDGARRAYASRVAGFLAWLADTAEDLDGDPLVDVHARDFAVRDYRTHLKTVKRAKPATINAALTALDHFYERHLRLSRPVARRERQPTTAPEALDEDEQRRFLRAVERHPSVRNRAVALVLLYSGLRADELAQLDVDDVPISTRRGKVIVWAGKGRDGGTYREVQLHRVARDAVRKWLDERTDWPGAEETTALWLNRRGGRMNVRTVNTIVREIAVAAGLVHDAGPKAGKARVHPHTLRHTFGTQLLRNGVDVVTVADLMGHAKLDSTRIYTKSSAADRERAIDTALLTDE